MDDLQQAVAKLRALSPKLNSAADQAYRVVMQIEQFLAQECQVSVQAEVPVLYNDKGVVVTLMRYARIDGKFRVSLTNTDGDARFITRAWADCDRSEKLATFPALPRLLMALTKAVEAQIASTNATANTVNQLVSALGASEADEPVDGEPPKLTLVMKPEETLAETAVRGPRPRPTPKANPDAETRRHRKDEAKVG
jgi:ABC-type transporter Mla subunit MlaD